MFQNFVLLDVSFRILVIRTQFLVNVPVLSKQNVSNCEPYTVFCGYVPDMPLKPNLNKDSEQVKLKNIGKGGGADEVRKSTNLKNTNNLSMSLTSCKYKVAKNAIKLTITTSPTNIPVDLSISGSLTVRLRILRIIRPRCVVKPVFMTIEQVFCFVSRIFEPQQIQVFEVQIQEMCWIWNLPIGIDQPVRLASFTQISPQPTRQSAATSVYYSGIYVSPGTRSLLSIISSLP